MALRDQPYFPMYVQDFLTDEKLIECSASASGVYIRLLCIMHKSEEYGTILLRQKDKQTKQQIENFALKLAKQMPYSNDVIHKALHELLDEGVLQLKGDKLLQKRMIYDNELSLVRANAGQKGGLATAKKVANTENENEVEIEGKEVVKKPTKKTFDFESVWIKHPNKLGKKEALGYFNITVKTEDDFKNIHKAVDNFNRKITKDQTPSKFVQKACNWFDDWESWINYGGVKEESNLKKPDPNCKVGCNGTGFVFNQSTSIAEICGCRKK